MDLLFWGMTLSELVKRFSSMRVAVVGDAMLDRYIFGEVHRVSPEAPVPIVEVSRETLSAGGAANVAVNVAGLGSHSILIAPSATDSHGRDLSASLLEKGVDTRFMWETRAGTIVKTRIIAGAQQICRVDSEGIPGDYSAEMDPFWGTVEKELQKCDLCIISDYAKGAVTNELVRRIRTVRRDHNLFLAYDPSPKSVVDCAEMDLLTPNREEAILMAKARDLEGKTEEELEKIFEAIHNTYLPATLAVTLGPDGIAVGWEGVLEDVLPTEAREVFDVSGAGDTVISVMAIAMTLGAPAQTAAGLANLAAGCVVRKVGTHPITAAELLEAIQCSEWRKHEFDLAIPVR
jgi:D-beta-D-heptose 7-phosphate kinase/D-beta-D-heptose 1-phosphate adenosyltransferase